MDNNFWFYTLSAIPQTLGAIIALSATFVVFKWSKIEESISSHIYHIKIIMRGLGLKNQIPKNDNPEEFLKLFSKFIKPKDKNWIAEKHALLLGSYKVIVRDPYIEIAGGIASADDIQDWLNDQVLSAFEKNISNKKIMFSYLWQTLFIIGFTIIFCLFFLPFGIGSLLNDFWKTAIISFSVGLTGSSIVATAISILRIIKL